MNLIERIHGHSHDAPGEQQHAAPFWVRFYDPIVRFATLGRINKIHRGTISLANLQPGESVLDIGCGTGDLILVMEPVIGEAGTAVGLDVESAMIAQAQQKADKAGSWATFEVATIEEIPYPDDTFDLVTSTAMIHHLTPAQVTKGLPEVYRVLKPNGRFLIVDINTARRSLISRLPGHRHLARQDRVQDEMPALLQTAGFSHIQTGSHPFKALSYAIGVKS
ncbi:MAG: methyltransferase domain-containing protein [Chloroflexota bacterium]